VKVWIVFIIFVVGEFLMNIVYNNNIDQMTSPFMRWGLFIVCRGLPAVPAIWVILKKIERKEK
jgi:hypothetical protein